MDTPNEIQHPRWYRIRYWDNENFKFSYGFWFSAFTASVSASHIEECILRNAYMRNRNLYFADIETSTSFQRPLDI